MAARSKARKRALDILYEAEQRKVPALELLRDRLPTAMPPISEYAIFLIEGVVAHQARIDELVADYAIDWTLDRMPPVDRAVLRLGLFELLWVQEIPEGVAVSEAVELASALSTDESPRFINGILARIAKDRPEIDDPITEEELPYDDSETDAGDVEETTPDEAPVIEVTDEEFARLGQLRPRTGDGDIAPA